MKYLHTMVRVTDIDTSIDFPPKVVVLGISGPWDREIRIPHVILFFPGSRSCKKDENIIKNGGVECEVEWSVI